jgi:hypothetical protein
LSSAINASGRDPGSTRWFRRTPRASCSAPGRSWTRSGRTWASGWPRRGSCLREKMNKFYDWSCQRKKVSISKSAVEIAGSQSGWPGIDVIILKIFSPIYILRKYWRFCSNYVLLIFAKIWS